MPPDSAFGPSTPPRKSTELSNFLPIQATLQWMLTPDTACQYLFRSQIKFHMFGESQPESLIQASMLTRVINNGAEVSDEIDFCCFDLRSKSTLKFLNSRRKIGLTTLPKRVKEVKEMCWWRMKCPENMVVYVYRISKEHQLWSVTKDQTRIKMRCVTPLELEQLAEDQANREREAADLIDGDRASSSTSFIHSNAISFWLTPAKEGSFKQLQN